MKLVLNNVTYRNCPVHLREKVAFPPEKRCIMLKKMRAEKNIFEAVVLETCSRSEFYIYAKKDFDVAGFLAELIGQVQPEALDIWSKYSRQSAGADAVQHLFEVVAGLDSQMLGENQVLSQVKSAYTESIDCRMSKFLLHHLFHEAFRVGKSVRTNTDINCGAVSISLAAVELAKKKIDLSSASAMVIGAGENAALAAKYLLKARLPTLTIANRNADKAQVLRTQLKAGEIISLADIANRLADVDLVISSTAATEPVVTYQTVAHTLSHRKKPLLLIDLAVPRDIEPQINQFECVSLFNIDDLNEQISLNKEKRNREIPKAQAIAEEFTGKFMQWYDSLNLTPTIIQLTQQGLNMAHSEADRYAKDFGEGNADKLELFAESLVKKILHGPITFLKNGDDEKPSTEQLRAVDLINKMFLSQGKRD
ncbi:MAG: glutamyl-tRNA reductase [Phycisphaerae bacterium]|nr:glutamyl-tRNA reductase [Phycisphaerae bacterium]MDD5381199.1 glutamyl-tRNA reductase [Phycisphaerae bacterium]